MGPGGPGLVVKKCHRSKGFGTGGSEVSQRQSGYFEIEYDEVLLSCWLDITHFFLS